MRVIPAIDLLNGQAVRLQKGDYADPTVYDTNPLNTARKFKEAGFDYIHVVDLNGAKEGNFSNLALIRNMVEQLGLEIQTGGGIRSYNDAKMLMDAGIKRVVVSSMAFKKEDEWLKTLRHHPENAILGMDLKEGKMAYAGWLETSETPVNDYLARMKAEGLRYVLSTDISRDGMLSGTNLELYKQLTKDHPELNIIASGGVAGVDDLRALSQLPVWGVVIGKAYYENRLTLREMANYNN